MTIPSGLVKDAINPSHYKDGWSDGAELISITENLNFNRGNAVKCTARAGAKDPAKEIEDLEKAMWYLSRGLKRVKAAKPKPKAPDFTINPGVLGPPITPPGMRHYFDLIGPAMAR